MNGLEAVQNKEVDFNLEALEQHHTIQEFLNTFSLAPEVMVQWNQFFDGTLGSRVPTCVIHSCCGPCSLYPLQSLTFTTNLICYYYNPNIHPIEEYRHRKETQVAALRALNENSQAHLIALQLGVYEPAEFFKVAKTYAQQPEGGLRCAHCFELRLKQTAQFSQQVQADYFLSVMSVSRHKSSAQLAQTLSKIFSVMRTIRPLLINFKKKGGTQLGRELSERLKLYHQPYCGCIYSMRKPEASN